MAVGWRFSRELDTIDVGGMNLPRIQDVRRNGPAATVIDDLASVDPWQPRGVEIRGRAEAIEADRALSRIHPDRIVSWGIRNPEVGRRDSRDVTVTEE